MLLKFSLAYFAYNCVMAVSSAIFPKAVTNFIESHLPLRGGWLSALTYLLFYTVDESILA
jgi:hypothetical protein